MEKENKILRKVGTQTPFRVPEHYFEDFQRQLMEHLPEKDSAPQMSEPTLWQRVKPWIYMTAMFCGIMLSAKAFIGKVQRETFPISVSEAEDIPEEDWKEIIDKSMMDDYSLFEYLTEAENNDSNN